MSLPLTESSPSHPPLDTLDAALAVRVMVDGQRAALDSVKKPSANLIAGAKAMADAVTSGGTLIYAAAGSSGLMALADACELGGTFGISQAQLQIHMAGGIPTGAAMPGHTEDATPTIHFTPKDVAIVLSASGTTPYALSAADQALEAGATLIGIANNDGSPLLERAHIPICAPTPAEVVAGSTRLGAGSAQKVALNILSTLMGVNLGHVYQGLMVNVVADNDKLRQRAVNIVCTITGCSTETAQAAISETDSCVKTAIVVASGQTHPRATELLKQHNGHLGPILNSN